MENTHNTLQVDQEFAFIPEPDEDNGFYDMYGNFFFNEGGFIDINGNYFNKQGLDKYGGTYNEYDEYIPGEGWIPELQCYEQEINKSQLNDEFIAQANQHIKDSIHLIGDDENYEDMYLIEKLDEKYSKRKPENLVLLLKQQMQRQNDALSKQVIQCSNRKQNFVNENSNHNFNNI